MPYSNVRRPSLLMQDIMTGKTPYYQADKSIQSAVSQEFYKAAVYVLDGDTNQEKRKRLDNVPEYVKPYIEEWIRKLLKCRSMKNERI